MFEKLIRAAIEHRWLVLLAAIGMAAVGVFSYQKLPIDAVPDIPNFQVQIPTYARFRIGSSSRSCATCPV